MVPLPRTQPRVADAVHWYSLAGNGRLDGPHAAIITAVHDAHTGVVALQVLHVNGTQILPHVEYGGGPVAGRWTWPPKAVG